MINQLLQEQIRKHFGNEELPEKFKDLFNDISATYEQFEKSNTQLDHFVYTVSHDLRAPLSSMKGVVIITEEETKEELTLEHMRLLKSSIGRLDEFILDILDYCRSKRMEVKKEAIDFKAMLNEITENLKHMTEGNRHVNISIKVAEDNSFCSDKAGMNIVLNNLLSNAIRYHNPDNAQPFVNIEVKAVNDSVDIVISDNGIGIRKELHEKIFEMFYRISQDSEGSGLGLFLVKETIDKLNGNILVRSEEGSGTEFRIHIPNN
jgi:signal transduction histidine kinase